MPFYTTLPLSIQAQAPGAVQPDEQSAGLPVWYHTNWNQPQQAETAAAWQPQKQGVQGAEQAAPWQQQQGAGQAGAWQQGPQVTCEDRDS